MKFERILVFCGGVPFLLAIFLSAAAFSLFAEEVWTLERCVEHALKHNKSVRLQMQNISADSARLSAARAVFYPDLSASLRTGVSYRPFAEEHSNARASDPRVSNSANLSSGVTIFDGAKNRNRRTLAEKNLEASKVLLANEKKAISASITRAYISLLHAQEALVNADEAVALSQKQMEFQQNLQEVGKATALSLSRSRAQLAKNRHSQTIAQNGFDNALLEMKKLLELDFESDFKIAPLQADAQVFLQDEESETLAAQIFEDNKEAFSEIESARLSVETAEISHLIARRTKVPSLSAGASLSSNFSGATPPSYGSQTRENFSMGANLNLSVPIIDNRSARAAVAVSQSNLQRAKITLARAEQNVRFDIEQLVADIRSSRSRFSSAQEQFEAEEQNMRTVEEMHNISNITAIDYASQQNNFLSAQSELTQAKYSLILSQKLLEIYLGER